MEDIYGHSRSSFLTHDFVLCDVYDACRWTGKKTGMPILYYKANTANSLHDSRNVIPPRTIRGNIYNYWDNQELLEAGQALGPDRRPAGCRSYSYASDRGLRVLQEHARTTRSSTATADLTGPIRTS